MGAWQEIVDYTVPSNTTSVVLDSFGTITKDDFVKVVITGTNQYRQMYAGILYRITLNNDTIIIVNLLCSKVQVLRQVVEQIDQYGGM